jgi:hypothetical protein
MMEMQHAPSPLMGEDKTWPFSWFAGNALVMTNWLENKIFNPKKCRGASLGAPQKGGHTCLPVGREGRPYELINQFSLLLATRQGHECFSK